MVKKKLQRIFTAKLSNVGTPFANYSYSTFENKNVIDLCVHVIMKILHATCKDTTTATQAIYVLGVDLLHEVVTDKTLLQPLLNGNKLEDLIKDFTIKEEGQ